MLRFIKSRFYTLKLWVQRRIRGWDDLEVGDLDVTIAKHFLKDLEVLNKHNSLDPVIKSFKYLIGKNPWESESSVKQWDLCEEGIKLLGREFLNLDPDFVHKFAEFVTPRLKRALEIYQSVPSILTADYNFSDSDEDFEKAKCKWESLLCQFIIVFEELTNKDKIVSVYKMDETFIQRITLFFRYFTSLWD